MIKKNLPIAIVTILLITPHYILTSGGRTSRKELQNRNVPQTTKPGMIQAQNNQSQNIQPQITNSQNTQPQITNTQTNEPQLNVNTGLSTQELIPTGKTLDVCLDQKDNKTTYTLGEDGFPVNWREIQSSSNSSKKYLCRHCLVRFFQNIERRFPFMPGQGEYWMADVSSTRILFVTVKDQEDGKPKFLTKMRCPYKESGGRELILL